MRTFELEAMGCDVVVGGGTIAERRAVVRLFAERDRVFSRFRPDSELTRVNASSGRLTAVSQIFARALGVALAAAEETGGLVDPTLGAAIEAAGYTRDFAELEPDDSPLGAASPGSWRSIVSGPGLVQVGRGVKLDLNGVVKAMAVDDALARLSGSAFVSAGGDLAAQGPLDVALPGGGSVRVVGGLATSGSARRNWLRSGGVQHHLIDPRSGRPAESPWSQVTVAGRTCLAADVAAKAAFLLGEEGPGWLDDRGLPGRFLDHAGEVLLGRAWAESLEREAACI